MIITGIKGGLNGDRIIKKLNDRHYSSHKLSEELNLDYKTFRHFIKFLKQNNVVKSIGEKYGKISFYHQLRRHIT